MTHRDLIRTPLTMREARGRLCRYLQALGFKVRYGMDREMVFERRSALGWLPGSPPRAWRTQVHAAFHETATGSEVLIEWSVWSGNRIVAVWDRDYFRAEAQGAVRSAAGTKFSLEQLHQKHLSAGLKSLAVYVTAVLVLVMSSVLTALGDISPEMGVISLCIVVLLLVAMRVPVKAPARTNMAQRTAR